MVMNDFRPKYAPGYRFCPKDEELILEYLMKKIKNQPIPIDIPVINFNDHNPDCLSGAYPPLGDNEWYFFTLRNRKYENGSRPDRTTPGGFWKATVADKPVADSNGVIVGSKRSLKFFEGTPSKKPIKTDWIMHEFIAAANQPSRNKRDANGNMKLDDLVMCRIHKKTVKSDNNLGLPSEHRLPLPPALENRDVYLSSDCLPLSNVALSEEEDWTSAAFDDLWSTEEEEPAVQDPPHGVLLLDHLPLPPAPVNRDLPPDDRLALPAPGAYVDLSSDFLPQSALSDEEYRTSACDHGLPSSWSELTAEEVYYWTNFLERLRAEAQEPNVPESSHGVSSYEFAGDEDYYGRTSALKGVPTEEEEEQQQQHYNGMPSSPPQKRARHFYDQF